MVPGAAGPAPVRVRRAGRQLAFSGQGQLNPEGPGRTGRAQREQRDAGRPSPAGRGRVRQLDRHSPARVNTRNSARGPLLLISGQHDHIVPDIVTHSTFSQYRHSTVVTDLRRLAWPATSPRRTDSPPRPATRQQPSRHQPATPAVTGPANATIPLEQAAPAITARLASTHPPDRAADPAALNTWKHHRTETR